jgi:hypothetical protein
MPHLTTNEHEWTLIKKAVADGDCIFVVFGGSRGAAELIKLKKLCGSASLREHSILAPTKAGERLTLSLIFLVLSRYQRNGSGVR